MNHKNDESMEPDKVNDEVVELRRRLIECELTLQAALNNKIDSSKRERSETDQSNSREQLEQSVNERTAWLTEANSQLQQRIDEYQRQLKSEQVSRTESERANQLRQKFLTRISHDLRTPLTSIKGFATTLLAKDVSWDKATQHEFIEIINDESNKLSELIEQLLDWSRLQSGHWRIALVTSTVNDIMNVAQQQLVIVSRNHQLTDRLPLELPTVIADPKRIAQVVVNLVDNAAQRSPVNTEIRVSASVKSQFVQICVRDHGSGIPVENRTHIFEPFWGLEDSDTLAKGAGLGLAICWALVEAHGGHIWIEDHDGPGTLICFTLPTQG